jgi:hypothetical protein
MRCLNIWDLEWVKKINGSPIVQIAEKASYSQMTNERHLLKMRFNAAAISGG